MNTFHIAWRAGAVVRPLLRAIPVLLLLCVSACGSATSDPAPTPSVHHDPVVKGADTTNDGVDSSAAETSPPAPAPTPDWGSAGGSGSGGTAPVGSSKATQPKLVM